MRHKQDIKKTASSSKRKKGGRRSGQGTSLIRPEKGLWENVDAVVFGASAGHPLFELARKVRMIRSRQSEITTAWTEPKRQKFARELEKEITEFRHIMGEQVADLLLRGDWRLLKGLGAVPVDGIGAFVDELRKKL